MTSLRWLAVASLFSLAGCGSDCPSCGACATMFVAHVTLEGGGTDVRLDGEACTPDGDGFRCAIPAPSGTRTVRVEAEGFVTSMERITTPAAPPGCCACAADFSRDVVLRRDGSDVDAGATDGGTDGGPDAGADAGRDAAIDAGAMACDESLVRFVPPGGHLVEGQLCDDVFACPASDADAARILAASPAFECTVTSEGPCTGGQTCVLRPSVLDAAEIQQICSVIGLTSPPPVTCFIYL